MSTHEFNKQMLSFSAPLKYFAISLTADHEDAADLLQDTMLKALIYKEKYADSTNLKAWLYTIMKNTFINNYRRNTKTRQIIDKTKDLYFLNIPQSNTTPSPVSLLSEKDIKKQIEALEDDLRIPFMRYFEGYKYKEIADALNIPIGTVKSRIFLARKKLIVSLKDFR
jgi:RNA polymerase sigma-70 factor (ECF subfamily)